jgi:hypothetical protein
MTQELNKEGLEADSLEYSIALMLRVLFPDEAWDTYIRSAYCLTERFADWNTRHIKHTKVTEWVCEDHPDKPWGGISDSPDACHCGGAGAIREKATGFEDAIREVKRILPMPTLSTLLDDLQSALAAKDAEIARLHLNWFSMDTAPKDGRWIQCVGENGQYDEAQWYDFADGSGGDWNSKNGNAPYTCWYPLNQEAEISKLRGLLRAFIGCAYPVAESINPRRHAWCESNLDGLLDEVTAALAQKGGE